MSREPDEIISRAEECARESAMHAESARKSADSALFWGIIAIVAVYAAYRLTQETRNMIAEVKQ